MARIDRNSPQKLYLQLAALIEDKITSQELAVGDRLPTEDQLCEEFSVSKAVVRHAMEHLANAGYIKKIAGKGTFVQRNVVRRGIAMRFDVEDPTLEGLTLSTKVVSKSMTVPPVVVAEVFGAPIPRQVFKLVRLFVHNDTPKMIETAFFRDDRCPGLSVVDFRRLPLIEVFERQIGLGIGRVQLQASVTILSAEEAQHLKRQEDDAATEWRQVYYDREDNLLGYSRCVVPLDVEPLSFEVTRLHG